MADRIYEKGTIKVVWVESDPGKIYSKMFTDEKSAIAFAKEKRDFVIFSLLTQKDMTEFSWELLPYGRHTWYRALFRLYRGRMAQFKRLIGL